MGDNGVSSAPARARLTLTAVLIAVVGAALFGSTWTDAVQAADSGELVTAACNLGVPHPPGYPLYTLAGHVVCQLPWSTPAGRLGLLSVVAGIWTLLLLHLTVVRLTGNNWAGAVAALTLASGSIFWRYSSVAEVFVLNAALCISLIYAALRTSDADRAKGRALWAGLTGLCAGLALSNHHSAVLVLPAALVALLAPRPSWRWTVLRGLAALGGAAIGLLPYLHLMLAAPDIVPRWGETSSLDGLLHHFLRQDYGTLSLALSGKSAPLQNLWHYISHVPSQQAWLMWPLALLGMAALVRRTSERPLGQLTLAGMRRELGIVLAALPWLAGPLFIIWFNIEPEGIGAQVTRRFFILPNLLLALCLGVGLAVVDATWLVHSARASIWRGAAWVVVGLAALLSYSKADSSQSYTIEDYARNMLSVVEKDALVLGQGDVRLFSTLYVQQTRHVRPDVQYVDVRMLLYPWYVAQKRRERPGFSYRFRPLHVNTLALIQREMHRGVPVYLSVAYNEKVLAAYGGYPVGPLFRLLPPGVAPPGPKQVNKLNQRLFRGFARRGRHPDPEVDPWAASLAETYANTWRSIARMLYRTGDRRGALKALVTGQRWAPWLEVPDWFGRGIKTSTYPHPHRNRRRR